MLFSQNDSMLGENPYIISFHFKSTCMRSSQFVQSDWSASDRTLPILSSSESCLTLVTIDFLLRLILSLDKPLLSLFDLVNWQNDFWNSYVINCGSDPFGGISF